MLAVLGLGVATHAHAEQPASIPAVPAQLAQQVRAELTAATPDAPAPLTAWQEAMERVHGASALLGRGMATLAGVDTPAVGARVAAYFQVQLRHALAAGERWWSSLVDPMVATAAGTVRIPDLTVLVTEPVKGSESSGFGWREDPIHGHDKFHKGADYRADRGTPVHAAGGGVVVIAGTQNGYGKVVYVDHGGGLITRYAHMRKINVRKGEAVAADDVVGEVGATGRATGPHLHFEVRIDGRAVDPNFALDLAAMQRTEPAGLVRLAAMALVPEVQRSSVSRQDPPKSRHKNRPERSGRRGKASRRERPAI